MHLKELFQGIRILETNVSPETDFVSVSADSRKVSSGGLFVCLDGTKCHGECFICDALSAGATAVVAERMTDCFREVPYILVENSREAFAWLCNNMSGSPGKQLNLYAVTGTNGKTTVANMLGDILRASGEVTEVIGTISGEMTTPDPDVLYPLLRGFADSGVKNVVMEASSHALALKKLVPLRFRVGIFTNLTKDHTDFHIDMERYFHAKASLFELCDKAVINIDDLYGKRLFQMNRSDDCFGVSAGEDADTRAAFMAKNIVFSPQELRYELVTDCGDIFRISSPMPWKFNLYNTLCAAAAAVCAGVDRATIRDALMKISGVKGRLERIIPDQGYPGYPHIYIDYAHTPDALYNALMSLRGIMALSNRDFIGRLTVLFGCGGDRDREKRSMMGSVASRMADFVIITSDNSRSEDPSEIIKAICRGIDSEKPHIVIEDRREAIVWALEDARVGDVLLLAGKGHEEYIIDESGKHYFSEREIIQQYYNSKR